MDARNIRMPARSKPQENTLLSNNLSSLPEASCDAAWRALGCLDPIKKSRG
jgi:hypothetical protein